MHNVHVFIVNYNSVDLLEKCMESLVKENIARIHIVDNYSSAYEREHVAKLPEKFARTVVTLSDSNVGFGPAHNLAIANAGLQPDDIIWILNPDTRVSPGAVSALVEYMRSGYDIVSPVILTGQENDPRVWFSGGILDRRQLRTEHVGLGNPWEEVISSPKLQLENTFITGAAMMMSYATWIKVGGFREAFFLYWEDAELSDRAVAMGCRLGVATTAFIWHAVGGSGKTSGMSGTYYYYMQRNRMWFGRQWQSRRALLVGGGLRETIALTLRPLKEETAPVSKAISSLKGLVHGVIRPPL